MRKSVFFLCLLALLSGCAANPLTGRSQLMLVSEKSAIAESRQAYRQMLAPLSAKGKVNSDAKVQARVEAITNRLVAQAIRYRPDARDWDWQVSVIEDGKTVNAFCMAGGKMAVYTGLLEQLKPTDDELAQVMGHEIAHALVGHSAEKMSVTMASQLGVAVLAAAAATDDRSYRRNQAGLGSLALVALQLPNSREAESEADRVGIEIAARAGYDPNAAVSLWKKMMAVSGEKSKFDFLSTHPASSKRIESLSALVPAMMPLYEAKEERPSFVPRMAANERVLDGPGAAAEEPSGPPLALVSARLERFRTGEARLACGEPCRANFVRERDDLQRLYAGKNWRELADRVMTIGYRQDLAYFYLAIAAENLGHREAANRYYGLAMEDGRQGASCRGESCAGLDLPREIRAGLLRVKGG